MKLDFLSKQLLIFASSDATSPTPVVSLLLLQTDAVAVTTVDRGGGVPTLTLTLLLILLGMMIVTDASTTAREKLLQLTTAAAGANFRRTGSAAARPVVLHFQLLAQLRVVVQIKVQVAADGGDRNGVRDRRGNCISQTSSYFRHRRRRRSVLPGLRRCRRPTLFQRSVGSRARRRAVGEMIDQQRRRRRRGRRGRRSCHNVVVVMVVMVALASRRLLQQQLRRYGR